VAGPSIKGGVVGKHLSLSDLDGGDLRLHTDFRQVYATLLGGWLGCDSKAVLGAKWDQVKEARAQGVRSALRASRFPDVRRCRRTESSDRSAQRGSRFATGRWPKASSPVAGEPVSRGTVSRAGASSLAAIASFGLIQAHRSPMLANAGPGLTRFGQRACVPYPSTDSCLRCRFPMTPAFPAEPYSAGQMIPRPVASMTGVSRHMIGG
jgi:hypothetical protein